MDNLVGAKSRQVHIIAANLKRKMRYNLAGTSRKDFTKLLLLEGNNDMSTTYAHTT